MLSLELWEVLFAPEGSGLALDLLLPFPAWAIVYWKCLPFFLIFTEITSQEFALRLRGDLGLGLCSSAEIIKT